MDGVGFYFARRLADDDGPAVAPCPRCGGDPPADPCPTCAGSGLVTITPHPREG